MLPALFAPYRDLAALRHDYPLVLTPGAPAASLAELFAAVVTAAPDDAAGERFRGHARRIETALCRVAASGGAATLAEAWDLAAARLDLTEPGLAEDLGRLRAALPRDGALADCDRALPARLVAHEWREQHRVHTEGLRAAIGTLAARLETILQADFATSAEALSPNRLRAGMGASYRDAFDFEAMSRVLVRARKPAGLDVSRRRRISLLLAVLRGQRFAPLADAVATPHEFVFTSCAAALKAWRERLPEAAELARAIGMARLEVLGEYDEERHDPIFAAFGATHVPGAELPDYLVTIAESAIAAETPFILQAFGAGLPFKVLVQRDDLLDPGPAGTLALTVDGLAMSAVGLAEVFVLQQGAAHLYGQRTLLRAALAHTGPALVHVHSGAGPGTTGLPAYLVSAAAVESRAFPGFVYNPAAGPNLASRFSLAGNPQPQADWALHPLAWEDAAHHRQDATVAFTAADFLACDARAAEHLAAVAPSAWSDRQVPLAEALEQPGTDGEVPAILLADADGRLHRAVADEALLTVARRCLARWRALEELATAGKPNAAPAEPAPAPAPAAPAPAPAEPQPEAETAERDPSVAYIETARCSSCNECIHLNDRMFGYDANKQASILDVKAGTYRQLVEAAENCQVSVIHPGKPWDQNEPGLAELIERAEPFL
jgi:hypothetical protein